MHWRYRVTQFDVTEKDMSKIIQDLALNIQQDAERRIEKVKVATGIAQLASIGVGIAVGYNSSAEAGLITGIGGVLLSGVVGGVACASITRTANNKISQLYWEEEQRQLKAAADAAEAEFNNIWRSFQDAKAKAQEELHRNQRAAEELRKAAEQMRKKPQEPEMVDVEVEIVG